MNICSPAAWCASLAALVLIASGARADNPGVVVIPAPSIYPQVVAISDVHGEFEHALTLLQSAHVLDTNGHWAAGKTLMIVTGDSIDKGPKSIEVLRLWMRLQSESKARGGRVVVLLGNHEAEFLANPQGDHKTSATKVDADTLHVPMTDLADPSKPLGAFLRGLPLAARVGDWVFCHAGWVPDEPWAQFVEQARTVLNAGKYGDPLLAAPDSILETKEGPSGKKWWHSKKDVAELERRLDVDGLAGVVFGHQPKALDMADAVGESSDGRLIKIDSGMAPPTGDPGDTPAADGETGQPYAGHLLIISNPRELEGRKGNLHMVSVAASGERKAAPIETPR